MPVRRIDERGRLVIGNLTERGELVIGNLTATGRVVFPAVAPVPPIPPAPPIFDGGGGGGGAGIWHSHQSPPHPHPLPRPQPLRSQRRHCVLSLPGELFSDIDLLDLLVLGLITLDEIILLDAPDWVIEEALLLAPRRPRSS